VQLGLGCAASQAARGVPDKVPQGSVAKDCELNAVAVIKDKPKTSFTNFISILSRVKRNCANGLLNATGVLKKYVRDKCILIENDSFVFD
jgi:hypothetical protein